MKNRDPCVVLQEIHQRIAAYYVTIETKFSYKIIQVFSDMDFLGWYSTGDSPGVQEITVHQQISDINESPLFLQANIYLCVGF